MENFRVEFEKIKESDNTEILNNFLIELSKSPNAEFLQFLKYFIGNLSSQALEKIKLNLIFVLGEIGSLDPLEKEYITFLQETYFKSDRWVRNEVIQALEKISHNTSIDEDIIILIGNALNDEYPLIKLSALSALSNLRSLPHSVLRNLFLIMNSKQSELLEGCRKVFRKISLRPQELFDALDDSENYKILNPKGIRSLLLIQFNLIINLEQFKELIMNSGWDPEYKDNFLREIETFERILIKNM